MPKFIVEIRNPDNDSDRRLVEWSTVVDAPVTYGMAEPEFMEYYRTEYGDSGMCGLDARMSRVRKTGTSSYGDRSWTDTIAANRAGPNETHADAAMLWRMFVTEAPGPDE
jgi:hypothetical protein